MVEKDIRKCKIRYDELQVETDWVDCEALFTTSNEVKIVFSGTSQFFDVSWMQSIHKFLGFLDAHSHERKYFEIELQDQYEYRVLKMCYVLDINWGSIDYSASTDWSIQIAVAYFKSLYPEY